MSLSHVVRGWTLRQKAAVLLVFAAGIPPLVVAALLLRQERDLCRAGNEATLRARVDQIGDTLSAMARGYAGTAARYAAEPDIIAFCAGSRQDRDRRLPMIAARLRVLMETDQAILGASLLDSTGMVIASTDGPAPRGSFADAERVRDALAGAPLPEVFVNEAKAPVIAFPAPVRVGGRVGGVYVLFVRAERFWDVMVAANDKAGKGSYSVLFDRHGFRIGHSANAELLFRPARPLPPDVAERMIAAKRFQERTAELVAAVVPFPDGYIGQVKQTTLRRFSPTNHLWNLGVTRYFESLGWTLVAFIPERELDVGVLQVVPQVLPPTLIGLVLALLGGAILMRSIVEPIRKLAAVAAALERGESPSLPVEGTAELRALAAAFHSMAASLITRDRSLSAGYGDLRLVLDNIEQGVLAADPDGAVTGVHSAATEAWFGPVPVGGALWSYLGGSDLAFAGALEERWRALARDTPPYPTLSRLPAEVRRGSRTFGVAYRVVQNQEHLERVVLVVTDMTGVLARQIAERQLEAELRQAQKLEAVGQIAAGVAHEINTPIQYIGDGARYVKDAFVSVAEVLKVHREVLGSAELPEKLRERLRAAEEEAELDYQLEEVPKALGLVLEGVQRVGRIVRAMKEFAHPDQKEMVPTDLNRALAATLEISRNEYKYVAEIETDLGELPLICCHAGDLNQVFLNIVVNAAHAIGDVVQSTGEKGVIRVTTRAVDGRAVITIADTGAGIPWEIRDKIFEPFFTTKPVGKGTGQGLAIARSVVMKHSGELTFESEPGKGTTFTIRLPIERPAAKPE